MSEYLDLIRDFPKLSVEVTTPYSPAHEAVLLVEAANVRTDNYSAQHLINYKTVYSWNSKFVAALQQHLTAICINGFPLFDNNFWLDTFIPVEKKIFGVCLIARASRRSTLGDISHLREEVFNALSGITKHAYGKIPFCGEHYRGVIGEKTHETYPSSLAKLKKLNEYTFSLCFENCYHDVWSWDYITEKIFDCFKAKTVPIYLGCYNIEQHIPAELFIDFRKFTSVDELSTYLQSISLDTISQMTEAAYQWVQGSRWGNVSDLRAMLTAYRS